MGGSLHTVPLWLIIIHSFDTIYQIFQNVNRLTPKWRITHYFGIVGSSLITKLSEGYITPFWVWILALLLHGDPTFRLKGTKPDGGLNQGPPNLPLKMNLPL